MTKKQVKKIRAGSPNRTDADSAPVPKGGSAAAKRPALPNYDRDSLRMGRVTAATPQELSKAAIDDLRREAGRDDVTDAPGAFEQVMQRMQAKTQADSWSRPEVQAAFVEQRVSQNCSPGMELGRLVQNLEAVSKRVNSGDMRDVEAMLVSQANALNTIFTALANRAVDQDYLKQYQTYMTLALKAQSQSRATLEALAYVKNPPNATFIRQQNNATNQQVNNGQADTRARGTGPTQSNEVKAVEHETGHQLDPRAPAGAGRQDQTPEAVEALHRPADA